MSPWESLIESPQPRAHFVQLYETAGASLGQNVSRYLWEGLKRGDGALVIATSEHWDLFHRELERLGIGSGSCLYEGQLLFLDAQQTLSGIMVGGQPDWDRFQQTIHGAMNQIQRAENGASLRAYGEMVAILWKTRQFSAAIRLEQFWNKLLAQSSFSLYLFVRH